METKSHFINYNMTKRKFLDIKGKPLNGVQISRDKTTVYRFRDGFLDGDVYDMDGRFITVKPAVEAPGHIEYWRKNMIHRDNDDAAVISEGFTVKEYWTNGIQTSVEKQEG